MRKIGLGPLERLLPSVNFALYANVPERMSWGPRTIADCQLYYVITGTMELQMGTKQYLLHAGDCIFYGKESPHMLTALSDVKSFSIHFDWHKEHPRPIHPAYGLKQCGAEYLAVESVSYFIDLDGYEPLLFPHKFSVSGLEPLFMQMVEEYKKEKPGYEFVLRSILMFIIATIVRTSLGSRPDDRRTRIGPALDALRNNPEMNWTVAKLAGLCGYHAAYFTNLFKSLMGCAPKQYLISERIRKAKYLLLGEGNLEQVSSALGYSSPHYFSRNFKEATGLTPSAFRQMSDVDPSQ